MGPTARERMTSTYNPVTHTGNPLNASSAHAKKVGLKLSATAAAAGNLQGGACIPKEGPATNADEKATWRPNALLHLPARVDHLQGGGCVPGSSRARLGSSSGGGHGSSGDGSDNSSSRSSSFRDPAAAAHAANKAKILTLRAAVDHLSGEACAVRHVDVVATLDAQGPGVSRGMATRLVRDRQLARAAQEHMMSSCLYQPGQGYTKVLSGASTPQPSAGV